MTDPTPKPPFIPDTYRLLAVFSGIPLKSQLALELAELRQAGDPSEISDHHRTLLRRLSNEGRIQWVEYGPDGKGYILTDFGTNSLTTYFDRYGPANAKRRGPALGELIRKRKLAEQEAREAKDNP